MTNTLASDPVAPPGDDVRADEQTPPPPAPGEGASSEACADVVAKRWRRLPEERPGQIIDAAFDVFTDYGLGGARLDEIARRAGVSKGTIYLYFSSKEELFRAVVESKVITVIEAAEADAQRTASELSAVEDLRRTMVSNWEYLRSDTYLAMHRLVHAELHHFPDLMRYYGDEVIERSLRIKAGIIARGIARGEFVATDPLASARIISAMLITHAVWHARRHLYRSSINASADVVRDTVIDFALRSLVSPAAGDRSPTDS